MSGQSQSGQARPEAGDREHYAWHHMRQPNGFTCGSTCVGMLSSILLAGEPDPPRLHPEVIAGMMGTNPRTGTTEVEMKRGLDLYGIPHERMPPTADGAGPDRMEDLVGWLEAGNMAMLRCLVIGMKHWILATHADARGIHVLDPAAQSPGILSPNHVASLIRPRGWEFWKIPANVPCRALHFGRLPRPGITTDAMQDAVVGLLLDHGDLERRMIPPEAARWLVGQLMRSEQSYGLWAGNRLLAAHIASGCQPWKVLEDAGFTVDEATMERLRVQLARLPGAVCHSLATAVHPDVEENGGRWLVDAAPGLFGFAGVHGIERVDEAAGEGAGATLMEIRQGEMRYFIRETPDLDGMVDHSEMAVGAIHGAPDDDAQGPRPSPG
ncbi:hypothetical protein [Acidiphilium sp. C61]|uniref:hypothetical protein n=1 Tax=Acidiphilium sp. C61 TaxID=1671485 RepID=UPI00157AEEF3|nr:hypothetical protein [Acidiphilium sp. C61]